MFTAPSLTFLLGPLFSKKSWLALDLGLCTAAGHHWQSQFPFLKGLARDGVSLPSLPRAEPLQKQGEGVGVLYIDEVHGFPETKRRLAAIMDYRRFSPDLPFHFASSPRYRLAAPYDIAALTHQASHYNVRLLIIDQPYGFRQLDVGRGTSLHVGRGTSFTSFRSLVSLLLELSRSANAAVLVLLQTRTRAQRSRLATALTSLGADHVLGLDFFPTDMPKATRYNKLLPRYRSGYLHLRTLASLTAEQLCAQAQIVATDRAFSLTPIERIPNLQTLKLSNFQPVLGPAGFEILALLAKSPASARQLIAASASESPGRVINLIKELTKDGYIGRTQPGGKGTRTNYALQPAGLSLIQGDR